MKAGLDSKHLKYYVTISSSSFKSVCDVCSVWIRSV